MEDELKTREQLLEELKTSRKRLEKGENLFRTFFNATEDMILLKDEQFRHIIVNNALLKFFGKNEEDVIGKTDFELMPIAGAESCRQTDQEALASSGVVTTVETIDGIIYETRKFPVKLEEGRTGVGAYIRDITSHIKKDEILLESESRFRMLFEESPVAISITRQGITLLANKSYLKMYAIDDLAEIIGSTYIARIAPSHRNRIADYAAKRARGEEAPSSYEATVVRKDGSTFPVHIDINQINLADGPAIVAFFHDLTERKQSEDSLRAINKQLHDIIDFLPDATFVVNSAGRVIAWNKATEELTEIKAPDMLGKGNYEYAVPFHGERRPILIDLVRSPDREVEGQYTNLERGETFLSGETFISDRKGGRLYLYGTASILKDENGDIVGAIESLRDITDRKIAEEALQDSEAQYRALIETTNTGFVILDGEGRVIDANAEYIRLSGHRDLADMVGKSVIEWTAPYERGRNAEAVARCAREGFIRNLEIDYQDGQGNIRPVEVNATFVIHNGKPRIMSLCRDIRERKNLEAQLLKSQKMEAIGTLAGGIAHDFNNILMGIQGHVSLMQFDLKSDHPHWAMMKRMEDLVRSGANLTRQLLGFAQGGKYEAKPLNVNTLIEKSADMFGRTKKELSVSRQLQDDIWIVEADSGQIEQVLLNLFINASQAMPNGGDLDIRTLNVLLYDAEAKRYGLLSGRYINISVTDTGTGMDKETLARIFEPFYTTKETGKGTGLGLASAYGIIKNHGGAILAQSEPGAGSTFHIYLPATDMTEKVPVIKPHGGIITGTETVLLVDDEAINIEVTRALLEGLGYTVFTASSGQEAIAMYMENKQGIDLIIMDMIMPGIGGGKALEAIWDIDPEAKVILSSGYSIDGEASKIMSQGCAAFIQKPFNLQALSRVIREALDGGGKA